MIRIHHNTAKRAAKFGITLTISENEVEASKDGHMLASSPQANKALDTAIAKLNGAAAPVEQPKAKARKAAKKAKKARRPSRDEELEDGEDEDEGDEEDASKSIVKRKYKKMYRPNRNTCGDELSSLITSHVRTLKGEDGKLRVDPKKLVRFAKANDVWVPGYADLNVGQQRMNIGNRLRAKVEAGHDVVWTA